jgi:probable F420-dependent oxidoreductase
VAFGIGTSSNVIVERWNGIPFEQPYQRTKESLQFVKRALEGGKVEGEWKTFSSNGFKLGRVPKVKPDYLVAALRPGMLRMAAKESDGAITNWLGADDVPKVKAELGDDKELVARILVAPNPDAEVVRKAARYAIAAYLNVPVYAQFHEWLGRGEVLKPMWEAWAAGDRKAALAAIPDSVCDELIVHGPPEACREQLARYHANGITTSALAVMPFGVDPDQAVRDLAPSTWAR